MPAVAIGNGAYKRTDGFVPEVRCTNMYVEKDLSGVSPDGLLRIQRPGKNLLYTLPTPVRGLDYRISTNERLTVAGGGLYSDTVLKGTIPGSGITPMVGTAFVYALVSNGLVYLYDTAVTALAALPEARIAVDVDQLNGYILIACSDGTFYWLEPGQTVLDPLNFATAESLPDQLLSVRRVGDEFWLFGASTVEIWQSTGDLDAPFQRVTGRQYERGCLARDTVRRFDNSVMWVSDDGQVCRGGSVAQVVSDNGIAERIRKRTSDPSAWAFPFDGHEFYCLRIPGQGTFAFDALTSQWCEFATLGRTEWAAHVGYDYAGQIYAGDSAGGAVWTLSADAGTDAGAAIERALTGTYGFMGKGPANNSLAIGVGCSEDCTIRVRWKDGQEEYPIYYEELDARAPLDIVNLYRLGQPDQPYRTVEISCIDTARIRIAGLMANEAWK